MVLKNKKALRLVVCMSLIVALAISAFALSVGATYENTHYNSGDQAQDIVGVAQTQVGYGEGSNGYTKYGDWYGLPNSDWCAMFVSWCANQAGVDTSTFQPFALCSAGCDWFISQGEFQYSGSYVPKAGDLIFYSSYGNIYHVGLVTGSDGSNVYSIEGNYNEMVSNVSYPLSYGDILGYATPSYSYASGTQNNYVSETVSDENYEDSDAYSDSDADTDSENDYDYEYTTNDEPEIDSEADEVYFEDTDSELVSDEEFIGDIINDELESEPEVETDTDFVEETTDIDTDTEEDFVDTEPQETEEFEIGDVNGDGKISVLDSFLIRCYLAEAVELDDAQFMRADIDASGLVDISDVITILEITI